MAVSQTRTVLLGVELADGTITGVTATQASQPINRAGFGILTFCFESVGTTSGGTLFIEEASVNPKTGFYSGTWSKIGPTITASDFTGGAQQLVHITNCAYGSVRARVATTITGGGSVSCVLLSQGGA